jgi:L-ribulose-5-phosphate 3-epimerase UlaE
MNRIKIGTMQGRLVPKFRGQYQAHPINNWHKEFKIAKKLNLDLIEFIFDYYKHDLNPIFNKQNCEKIIYQKKTYSIDVLSVCADYFMISPIHSNFFHKKNKSLDVLKKLIKNCSRLGVKFIVIPCVDKSSFKNNNEINLFKKNIEKVIPLLNKQNICLSIESDLPPKKFLELVSSFKSNKIKINYDIGNSAFKGYDCEEELSKYGKYVSHIHIKDRLFNGPSVKLGTGDADIKNMLIKLKKIKYKGPFILQAYRDKQNINIFKKQYRYFTKLLKETNWC